MSSEDLNNKKKSDDKKQIENLMNVSYSYPDPSDPELQKKIYEKREYILHRYDDRPDLNDYNDIKEYRENICARSFTLHDHQAMLSNFINPDTPYKGVLVFHGLGSGKCISANTLVNINGNLIYANKIWNDNFTEIVKDDESGEWSIPKEELMVNSFDEKTGKIIKKKVNYLFREKVKTKLREIVLENGSKVTITYAHKLLTANGFTNTLNVNDYICIPKVLHNFPKNNKIDVSYNLSHLMGWQLSNGIESEKINTVNITEHKKNILEKIKKSVIKVGIEYNLNIDNLSIIKQSDKNNYILSIHSADYFNFLKSNGYLSCENKQIPSFIMNSKKSQIKTFLKAYFDSQGSVNVEKQKIEIFSKSEIIIKQLTTLLKIFGIHLMTSNTKSNYYGYIFNDDLITYKNEIGFGTNNKNKKLENIVNKQYNANIKSISDVEKLHKLYEEIILKTKIVNCLVSNNSKNLLLSSNVTTNKKILNFVNNSNKEILCSKIVAINEIDYDDYVYDLEIDETHNFVTENIICHNTCVGVAIAEKFKSLVQKYNTKIVILVGGPLIKENWKQHLLLCTGETYLKYQDKSIYVDDVEKAKNEKMAMIQALQYYKFMSYKSFYKHVIGEKITDKQSDKKGKVTYRKTAEGEFERDVAVDRIYNLNNTLVVIDEAHNLTGNTYGEALKYIIKNSSNLKVVLMSGTPMKNLGSDIIEMINFIRPLNSQIERDKVFNSEKGHLMDFKPGGLEYLKNMMRGYISHIRGADPLTFAKRNDKGVVPKGLLFTKVIKCKMLDFQKKTYIEAVEQNQEDTLDRKSEAVANFVFPVLSSDKKELVGHYAGEGLNLLKNQLKINGELLNKKVSKILLGHENEKDFVYLSQDGHSVTGKFLRKEYLKYFSIKFYKALKKISRLVWNKKGVATAFIYSNLVKVGISLFSEVLIQNGYLEYQEDYNNYQINPNTVCYFCGKTHQEHGDHMHEKHNSDSDNESDSDDESDRKNVKSKHLDLKISDSSTDFEYDKKKTKSIPPHTFRPATFIVVTGKSNEEALEAMPEDKMNIIKNVFNTLENKDGRNLKFVLGSRVMNEGISLKHVKEVFILDAYFNFGRIDQVVGRAIRHCSHYKLMSEENVYPEVNVYKLVVALDEALSTEEELYQKAELKYLLIKKIERTMKEIAIDCPLNRNGNIFKEEVEQFKDCEKQGNCPAICDYTNCSFVCDDIALNAKYYDPERMLYKKIEKSNVDYSTFTQSLARNEIDFAKERIKEMYIMGSIYTLDTILDHIKASYNKEKIDLFDEFFVFKALDELIPMTENDFNTYKDTILDKHNRPGYIIYVDKYYIFQPFDQNEDVPMYYRTQVTNGVSQQQLSLYNYLKNTETYQSYRENKQQKKDDNLLQKDDQPYYNFDDTMEYYDNREEYDFVGFIDKEVSRRKTKSMEETKDVFKLREKRAKILEKKRATGVPSLKGAVCETSKSKKYLQKVAGKLGITIPKGILTRTDVCLNIRDQMLLLEKYSTTKDKNKFTYVMIPADHPTFPFPYNLEDRVDHVINKIKNEVGSKLDFSVKTTKKTTGPEKGYPSYIITIKNDQSLKPYKDFMEKNGAKLQSGNFVIYLE